MDRDEDGDGGGPDTQCAITGGLVHPCQAGERTKNHDSFELFHQELAQNPFLQYFLCSLSIPNSQLLFNTLESCVLPKHSIKESTSGSADGFPCLA